MICFLGGVAFDSNLLSKTANADEVGQDYFSKRKAEKLEKQRAASESCAPYQTALNAFVDRPVWFNEESEMSCSLDPQELPENFSKLVIKKAIVKNALHKTPLSCEKNGYLELEFTVSNGQREWLAHSSISTPSEISFNESLFGGKTHETAVNCLLPFDPKVKFKGVRWDLVRRLIKTKKLSLGLTKEEVQFVMGKPGEIALSSEKEVWLYGQSGQKIKFKNGRVVAIE